MKLQPLAICILTYIASFSQKNEQSILNNRFYITMPDSARNIAMRGDIMGPNPNENNQTRIMYDEGNKRLVFFATEMNLKTVADLAGVIKLESNSSYAFTTQEIFNNGPTKAFLLTPSKFDTTAKAILIKTLVVQNADSTLSRIEAYINPDAFAEKDKFMQMAEQAFATFRPGERRVNFNARVDTVSILGSKSTLQINLPRGYVIATDRGDDFEVYNIVKLQPYGATGSSSMLIYFGFYPSALAREYGTELKQTADTKSGFMFHTMVWNNYCNNDKSFFLREQVFEDDDIAQNMKTHIALTASKPEWIEELSGIAEKLLIVYGTTKAK